MSRKNIVVCEPIQSLQESLSLILDDQYDLNIFARFEDAVERAAEQVDLFVLNADHEASALEHISQLQKKFPDLHILLLSVNFTWEFQER